MLRNGARWIGTAIVLLLSLGLLDPGTARADVMYWTFTKDGYGRLIDAQPAYYPTGMLGKDIYAEDPERPGNLIISPLSDPQDVFVDGNDHIYIADTGNNRIVHLNERGEWVRNITLSKRPFASPNGVFVDERGYLYVADTGNKRVVKLAPDGTLEKEFPEPKHPLIPSDYKYDPVKVIVDKRGYMYIVSLGGYWGMLQLNPDGEFQKFYGTNKAPYTFIDTIKKALYTREMYENEMSKLPPPITNATLDERGFIYTVTSTASSEQVKKLNFRGANILSQFDKFGSANQSFGERNPFDRRFGTEAAPQLTDVAVDAAGNFTVVDTNFNYVSHYDANGNLLFFWGGDFSSGATQLGLVKNPVAVELNSRNELFILDSEEGVLQSFAMSEFGAKVYEANRLTLSGRYEESEGLWREVIRLNAQYNPAVMGLARAAYKKGDFEEAAELFRMAGNKKGYSEAFWQIRLQWFQKHFSTVATAAVTAIAGFLLVDKFTKNAPFRRRVARRPASRRAWIVQLKQAVYVMKHPIDGFSALRAERKGGYFGAVLLLFGAYATVLLSQLYTGFVFSKGLVDDIDALPTLIRFLAIWCGWVVCHYLVGSIYRGEARFRDVFISSAYALAPLIAIGMPLTFVSNFMTESEGTIYIYLENAMYAWVGLMFFWKVHSVQNYDFGETVYSIVMSVLTMATLGALLFILFGLTNELAIFVYEVYQEAMLR
ncbi:YIP1 family protein [Paenibacillus sp.]|uniref:YIP1 family protein n=1 Tax=Paenibacillus sp. TaxID=58172 RepID=UPI002D450F3F|nr:YIP1 family protein [Paenibacillus sp.]HZG84004.1 YIP1 family protein [Paenibacillus sp.]